MVDVVEKTKNRSILSMQVVFLPYYARSPSND